jgi:thioredoxin-like negative regulator of GroEL
LEEAISTLERITATMDGYVQAQSQLAVMALSAEVAEAGGEDAVRALLSKDANDPRARYLGACAEASHGLFVSALDVLLWLITDAPDVREEAKKAAGVVLNAAGRGDPKVEEARKRLARLLF